MTKPMISKNTLSEISFYEIETYYYRIDYWLHNDRTSLDMEDAKQCLQDTTFLGNMSSLDVAIYYVNKHANYEDYVYYGEDFEFHQYINHEALKKEAGHEEYIEILKFIDCKSVSNDIFDPYSFIDYFFQHKGNVFEITIERTDEDIDVDIVEHCYTCVQEYIDKGLERQEAILSAYLYFKKGANYVK